MSLTPIFLHLGDPFLRNKIPSRIYLHLAWYSCPISPYIFKFFNDLSRTGPTFRSKMKHRPFIYEMDKDKGLPRGGFPGSAVYPNFRIKQQIQVEALSIIFVILHRHHAENLWPLL